MFYNIIILVIKTDKINPCYIHFLSMLHTFFISAIHIFYQCCIHFLSVLHTFLNREKIEKNKNNELISILNVDFKNEIIF